MHRFLNQVGVPREVLNMVSEAVDTCSVCRSWAKPGPDHQVNIDLPDKFNEQVETDIVFLDYRQRKQIPVIHLVDRCTRWQEARELPSKNEVDLKNAINDLWVSRNGPPRELISDGEGGLAKSTMFQEYCKRHGIHLHERAVGGPCQIC